MSTLQKWILLGFLMFGLALGPVIAQLQQSGGPGSTVTANIGTTNGLALDSTLTGGTQKTKLVDTGGTNVGSISAAGALKVDGSAVTQPISGTVTINAIPAGGNAIGTVSLNAALPSGTNVIGVVNTIPKTACGNTVASQALAAVPTSATAVFAATTCLVTVVFNNTNGSAATVTLSDNAGTPVNALLTFSIPANSQLVEPLYGVAFTSGVKWTASTTNVTGAALGYQ